MKKDQVILIRDEYLKEANKPNGDKSTLGEYVRFALDGGIDFVTAKDLVVYDDDNELIHCICVNDNLQSQADFPVKMISSQYDVIQQIETIMSTKNMETFLDTGFLSGVVSDDQKEFIKKWMKTIKNQAIQPMDPEPMWKDETVVIPKGVSQLKQDPFAPVNVKGTVDGELVTFSSFDDAIAKRSVNGTTKIKLLENEKMVKPIQLNKDDANLEIDLNGYTLDVNDTLAFQVCNGNLTIKNGTIKAKNPVLDLVDNGNPSLTLSNVNITSENSYCLLAYGNGIVNIRNSKLTSNGEYGTISGNGSEGFDGTKITIENSTILNTNEVGIYLPQNAEISIINSSITGLSAIYQKSGKILITKNSVITGTGDKAAYKYKGGGYYLTGEAITVDACGYPGGDPYLSIDGAKVLSRNASAIGCYNKEGKLPENSASLIDIETATLNTAPPDNSIISMDSYCSKSGSVYYVKSKPVTSELNGYGYVNPADAITDAQDGDTINFAAPVMIEKPLTINKSITLNIKDIHADDSAIIADGEGVNVVINGDTATVKAGLVAGDAKTIVATNGATVTINGGTYGVCADADGLGNSCVFSNGGNIIINKGYFSSDAAYNGLYYVLNKKNKTDGTITVYGGTFENYNPEDGDDVDKGTFLADRSTVAKTTNNVNSKVLYTVYPVPSTIVDGKSYRFVEDAFKDAKDGSIISIIDDIEIKNTITIDKDISINLESTISNPNSTSVFDISSNVTIYGDPDSKVIGASGMDANAIMVRGNGNLTIKGGNYDVGPDASGVGNSTIYAIGNATVTIDGGHFETAVPYNNFWYVLNKQNKTKATFKVISGEFVNYNPEVGDDADGGNFVAEGSKVDIIDLENGNKLYKVYKA